LKACKCSCCQQTPFDIISLNIITDMYNYNLDNCIEKYNGILQIL